MAIRYISDWHFGHKNILAYDARPFKDVDEMNQVLIDRWAAATQPDDTVYVVGDMFWLNESKAVPILQSLPGTKILVKGNHDKVKNPEFCSQFADITSYKEIEDGVRHVVLCHFPIPCFRNHYHGWFHLYGHVHTSFESNMMERDKQLLEDLYEKPHHMYNVGAMMPWMGYTPRTLDEILEGYRKWKMGARSNQAWSGHQRLEEGGKRDVDYRTGQMPAQRKR